MKYEVWTTVKIRGPVWFDRQKKDSDGSIRPNELFSCCFSPGMHKYAGCAAVITKNDDKIDACVLSIDNGEYRWQEWMFEDNYKRATKLISLEGSPLPAKEAINAMLSGREVLHTGVGNDCFWNPDAGRFVQYLKDWHGGEYTATMSDFNFLYRERVLEPWIMTADEARRWAASAASHGWAVRTEAASRWTFPTELDYTGDLYEYQRARISTNQSGVDESTIQRFFTMEERPAAGRVRDVRHEAV